MAPTPAKKAKHSVAVLEEAVEAVRSKKMGLRKAARHFAIAATTLGDKVCGKTPIKYVPRTLLSKYEEDSLHQWLLKMSEMGFGQTSDDIRAVARSILELRGGTTKDASNLPSAAWVYRFFERHRNLKLRTPMSLGKERALVTPTNITKWFENLKNYIDVQDPTLLTDPSRIFNADESGFSFDPKARKVITWKGVKQVYSVTSYTKTQVTVLASMSAAGLYLPPLLIYPYKRMPGKNLLEGFPEALLQVSDNGWITSAIFYAWLRDSFIPATAPLKKPLLLLVDSHVSHKSLETSLICEENGIILYCLLAHASHAIQPLDQAFFGSIKLAWSSASKRHIAKTGQAVGLDSFAQVFAKVWNSSATCENAESSYRAAGIVPFSPERVLQTKKLQPCLAFGDAALPQNEHQAPADQASTSQSPASPSQSPASPSQSPASPSQSPAPPSQSPDPSASTSSTSLPEDDSAFTAQQLEALKGLGLFIVDELGRNGFLKCLKALTKNETEGHEESVHFSSLAATLKASFKS